MNQETDTIATVVDFKHKFNLILVIGNVMTTDRLKMRAEVIPGDDVEDVDLRIAFLKIKFWLDNVVSKSVAFGVKNTAAWEMLLDAESKPRLINGMMITPSEPNTDHLATLFQAKMAALSGGKMEFGCITVEAEGDGVVFTYVGDWVDDLPDMANWLHNKPYYFDIPWWCRDDASTLDVLPKDDDDLQSSPSWAFSLDFIEHSIRPKGPSNDNPPEPSVVLKGTFRPKVIDGDQSN